MRRLPSSRLIWLGPSLSSMVARRDRGTGPLGRLDQQARQAVDGARDSGRRTTSAKRRLPSTIWVTSRPPPASAARQHLRRGTPFAQRGVVDAHLDLRRQHLLFDLQVGQAGDAASLARAGLGLAAQGVQVVAEDLDGDLRAHARQHVVDAVRDGLADGDGGRQVARRCGCRR
jgi:hypothetical protein